jgi:hypothetical protein
LWSTLIILNNSLNRTFFEVFELIILLKSTARASVDWSDIIDDWGYLSSTDSRRLS